MRRLRLMMAVLLMAAFFAGFGAVSKADDRGDLLKAREQVGIWRKNPDDSQLALVTWTQQGDDRWFGAKIPDQVKSVEFVYVQAPDPGHSAYSYERYEGAPLTKLPEQSFGATGERMAHLLSQRAAVMP
jgi:hypothetical protein